MTDFVDMKYVNMLSGRLPRFSIKHRNPLKVYVYSCRYAI